MDGLIIQSKNKLSEAEQQQMHFPVYDGINYNRSGSYPVGQCTWYVYNRFKQLGTSVDEFMEMAVTGEEGRALGYQVSSLPKAGRAISFQPGVAGADNQYGHVALLKRSLLMESLFLKAMSSMIKRFRIVSYLM